MTELHLVALAFVTGALFGGLVVALFFLARR